MQRPLATSRKLHPVRYERTIAATALCLLGGCTALFGYPEPQGESSHALCSNGLDDDFDGLADCDDPRCDGHCAETGAACSDGRNNDGDSFAGVPLVDGADPSCWSQGYQVTRRCAFRPGTVLELRRWNEHEAFPNLDWVTSGTVELAQTILDKDVIRLLPRQFIETRAPITGALTDMGLVAHVFLAPGTELVLSFVSGRFGTVAEAHMVWPEAADVSRMWVEAANGERSNETSAGIELREGNYSQFEFYVSGGRWWLHATDEGLRTAPVTVDPAVPLDEPLTVRIEARGEAIGASGLVEVVSTARSSYDTCDRSHLSPLINAPGFRAAAESPELRCVVIGDRAHVSADGSSWAASRSTFAAGDMALAWVDAFQRFEGARLDPQDGTMRFFASADCDVFRESEPVSVATLVELQAPRLVGFDHHAELQGGARRVHLLGTDSAGARRLVELASETGDPDSYAQTSTHPWDAPTWTDDPALTVGRLGDSLWVVGPDGDTGNVGLFLATGAAPHFVAALLAPSGESGAFDRFRIQHARLVPLPPDAPGAALPARVYYFGSLQPQDPGYDSTAVRSGVEWRDILFGQETP